MLTKPEYGWSDFQLEQTSIYGLSYITDISVEWLDEAIRGLETMQPFCVTGFLEPGYFSCTVNEQNCHVERIPEPPAGGNTTQEDSPTGMLQFCEYLYYDVTDNLEDWVHWCDSWEEDEYSLRREQLTQRLSRLNELISERRADFDQNENRAKSPVSGLRRFLGKIVQAVSKKF